MIRPRNIKQGDKIAIVAPAGKIEKKHVTPAVEYLREKGFEVALGEAVFNEHGVFAGTDEQRTNDLQRMLDDPDVACIICARGGYGTLRVIENINWSKFKEYPKWLVGFSDITVIHSFLNNAGFETIHGVMPRYFLNEGEVTNELITLQNAFSGKGNKYKISGNENNRLGDAKGELVGGNLSIIYSLQATPYELKTEGKILFIEDLAEYHYHLDRMMLNLRLSGKLSKLKGLIVGNFSDMKDGETSFGKRAYEIIAEHVEAYDYPVCYGFPAGHEKRNMALNFGKEVVMSVEKNEVIIT
ncbi:LD-carboxypeptidase [Prolixibacteraceae bacterium JC049]|nr:LD-carboxypeptidase [Prolixibacteraceae bacterium JC049]